MREFTIFTDSSCDLSATMAQELDLTVLPLSVNIDGTSYENDLAGKALPFDTCYALLRAGKPATTSAVNVSQFVEAMEPVLQAGQDILYLGFSSALSGTYNAGAVACAQLAEQYPEAKLYAVDTLCAPWGKACSSTLRCSKSGQVSPSRRCGIMWKKTNCTFATGSR